MGSFILPDSITGYVVHFVGIKGTGMAALAELFHMRGAVVGGSDQEEKFYTDEILLRLGIPFTEHFASDNLPEKLDLLVYSSAYSPESNPEIRAAIERGIPIVSYTEALGALSAAVDSAGIAGVHGKTTTTAIAGVLVKTLGISAAVLAGSAVPAFGGGSVLVGGNDFFLAETCEYRRNFLNFHPRWLLFTSIETDHLDYFRDYEDILSAFLEYGRKLPEGGVLVYCSDDSGAREAARRLSREREDVRFIPYGFSAHGDYHIISRFTENETNSFRLSFRDSIYSLKVPGEHIALDAVGAIALIREIVGYDRFNDFSDDLINRAFEHFTGSKRRSEIIGESGGILFMDDYGHHPTEIAKTLKGYREFYPDRKIIVDFMSHTYSRTAALLKEFSLSFSSADEVILHKIYASAREAAGAVDGKTLFERTMENHSKVSYFEEPMDAFPYLMQQLSPGDLFVTMGAGNNWGLGQRLYTEFTKRGTIA
jgi:UDP-N-acetylmuramate--alanine ligase